MVTCIYCNNDEFKKVRTHMNSNKFIVCTKCKALYLNKKAIKEEIENQEKWKVYEYDGKSYT